MVQGKRFQFDSVTSCPTLKVWSYERSVSIKNNAVRVFHSRDYMNIKSCCALLSSKIITYGNQTIKSWLSIANRLKSWNINHWFSPTGMFGYKTDHLVKTSDNLRKSIVRSLHSLTSTCNGVTYPIGPVCKYFIIWQISQHPTYCLTRQEKDWHSNLSVRAFIVSRFRYTQLQHGLQRL